MKFDSSNYTRYNRVRRLKGGYNLIIGLDMGGTHIDAVIIMNGYVINKIKKPVDFSNIFDSLWSTLKELIKGYDKSKIERIHLSTTVSTNAIVENKISSVGMIVQSGPGLRTEFLEIGKENVFLSGYIDHRGKVVEKFEDDEINKAVKLFKENDIQSCAIVTKFSPRNPNNELEIKELIKDDFNSITLGHNLSGKLNFPRRVFTSYLNAAVSAAFNDFSKNMQKSLETENIKAPVYILKADGGIMNLKTANEIPVESILSGPAASFMGIQAMLNTNEDAILLDVGGTTTDIFFLADGIPLFEPLGIKIATHKTLVRAIYSVSIGLGGDSTINIKDGDIAIGPKREGFPCAFGGVKPTPTDAMVVLGLMDGGFKDRAIMAMESLGQEIDLSAEEVSKLILDKIGYIIKTKVDELLLQINSHPVYTIEKLLHGKKIEPKRINIIGGPAKVLSKVLEEKFNLPCFYPENYDIANAIGAALAKITAEVTMIADTSRGILAVPELGIYEKISKNYSLSNAKDRIYQLIKEKGLSLGAKLEDIEAEITEESSFNMVKGFYTTGKNIRIKGQIKPGLSSQYKGEK